MPINVPPRSRDTADLPSAAQRLLHAPLERWNDFWFRPGSADGLAIFRILLGTYWLARWLSRWPNVRLYFSGDGMYFPFAAAPEGGIHSLDHLFGALTPAAPVPVAWLLYLATLAVLILFIVGRFTRTAATLYMLLFVYHYLLHLHMLNSSFDRLLFVITGLMAISPCGQALSWDARRARQAGKPFPDRVPLWTQRLICVQVAFMYLGTGLFKIVLPEWNGGELIFTSLAGDWATPLGFWLIQQQLTRGWYDHASLATKVLEVFAAVLL